MKNVFKLIVLSAVRIFFKAKILIAQLLVLVLLAVSILGTISLSNITLAKSYENIVKNGNMADLTINNIPVNNNVAYDINGVTSNDSAGWDDTQPSSTDITIFDPLTTSKLWQATKDGVEQTTVNGLIYTPGAGPNNLLVDNNGAYISVNGNTPNANEWLPYAQDIFSLYKNVIPINGSTAYTNAELCNPSVYTSNPFSLTYSSSGNAISGVSLFGTARLISPNSGQTFGLTSKINIAHGVFDGRFGSVAGTSNSYNWSNPTGYSTPITPVTINIFASPSEFQTYAGIYNSENWKLTMPNQLAAFYRQYGSPSIMNALNGFTEQLSSDHVNVPYYTFKYSLVPNLDLNAPALPGETANSEVNFIYSQIFQNGKITSNYSQYLKYFQGTMEIPLIPNYTTTAQSFSQKNPTMNVAVVNTIIQSTLQKLSKQLTTEVIPIIMGQNPNFQSEYNAEFCLNQELSKLGLNYDESENVNLNNPLNGNQYIVAKANLPTINNPNPVNKIVLNAGINLFPPELSENNSPAANIQLFYYINYILFYDSYKNAYQPRILNIMWNAWQEYDFAGMFQQIMNAEWETKPQSVILGTELLKPLTQPVTSEAQWLKNIYPAYIKFEQNFNFVGSSWDGYGFAVQAEQAIPASGGRAFIPFTINIVDPTAYMAVLSSNFMRANSSTKSILPAQIAQAALQLPFEDLYLTPAIVNQNPAEYANHFIMNPVTKKITYYQDFLSWLAQLPNRYKITVNSQQYVIIGSGLSPDFMYPTLSSNDLLLNSETSGVVYTNSAGFYRSANGITSDTNQYISIRFPKSIEYNLLKQQTIVNTLEAFTKKIYGQNEVFWVTNPKQPNQLLYVRMNFSYDLRNVVLIVTVIIGIIIAILSLFFISTLLRSIIKQNKNILGIINANGIPKRMVALSFFPFAIIPAVICGSIGYLIAYFLTPSLTGMIASYWAPNINHLDLQWWLFILVPIFVLVILFALLMAVILWTIRKPTTELLTESSEFRMNWLIMHINRITKHLGALGSFRVTYVLGNVTRFFVLMAIVIAFITISGVFVGTIGTFQNALAYTSRNHQYTYAFDLYSPTAEGGYYSEIPMSQIGTSQQGLQPLYNIDNNDGFYGQSYAGVLQYPYQNNLYYTNLFLPCTSVASQIQGNVQFFKNKIFTKIDLDINLNFVGANINPWNFAKSFAPASVIALSNYDMQTLLTNAFDFFYWVQNNNLYQSYSPTTYDQPWTLNGSPITLVNNSIADSQNNEWIYLQKENEDGQMQWYLNPADIIGAPTFEFYRSAVRLFVDLITITQNPLYQEWAKTQLGSVKNYNYLLGNAVVATEPGDGTFTYLKSTITSVNGKPFNKCSGIQINGIKPQTNFVLLYNNKSQIMNSMLAQTLPDANGQPVYPLIINDVVARKFGFKVGDILGTETSNQLNRFILKYNNPTGNNTVPALFKIVGITSSRSGQTYYTSQAIANTILGYKNPGWSTNYVPFNGLFTRSMTPDMIDQFGSVYSPSGLSPAIGIWNENPTAGMAEQLFRSWTKLNKILMFNATNGLQNYNGTDAGILLTRLINTFGMRTPIVISIQGVQTYLQTSIMGQVMDQTVKNVMTFITVALIPTLIIIIVMLGSMIVVEARRLIALLKVLGYGNWSNTFSFLFVYLIVLFMGLGISIGLTYLILFVFSIAIFGVFNIIITPVAPWWIYFATFSAVAFIFAVIYVATYLQLRKINPAAEIAVR